VDLRRARQARLSDDNPLILDAVISETVLRRAIGGTAVKREQLEHLAAMVERPNITVRLLPFGAGAHPGLDGAFSVLEFPDPEDGRIVCVEAMTSTLYIEKPRDVGVYRLAFGQIQAAALGPDETAAAITATARELES
jgi:hypothetical protein